MVNTKYQENNFENAIQELFEELDYNCYCYKTEKYTKIIRDEHNPFFMSDLENIYNINKEVPEEAIDDALHTIQTLETGSLESKNDKFMDFLQNGVKAEYIVDNESRGEIVKLIDFDNIDNNQFTAIRQWTVIDKETKIPDIVVFINGLPLVVIELKSPSREEVDTSDGYHQIRNYIQVIPTLFYYNVFCVISDQAMSKAGTITANEDRFMEWKSVDGNYENTQYASFDVLFEGMFEKSRLLDIIKNFTLYSNTPTEKKKILGGYHQYFGVKKAVQRTLDAIDKTGKAGVFWHTQGSGKSLSMVFYVHLLEQILNHPTFIILTDRNDLDNQLFNQFIKCESFLRQKAVQAESRENLKELLNNRQSNGIFFTTIQKFEETDEPFSNRSDIVVIADEAHRSHYGFTEKAVHTKRGVELRVGTARKIRDALPNATFIGFTGTPIFKRDKNTIEVFGEYIDIYDMTQSVDDKATVPIHYESRVVKLNFDEEILKELDNRYEELSLKATEYNIERSKRQMSRLESILGDDTTIDTLCKDMIYHYENFRQYEVVGKAMFVAYNRDIAIKIYKKILDLRPEWKDKIYVVMSSSNNDPEEWKDIIGTKSYQQELENRFKDPEDPFKIVIVRDMWLTGFDVESLSTMYIYKPMDGHNLMQAIARVNRVFPGKEGGLIVDYIAIASALKKAMSEYTVRDIQNFGNMDVSEKAYPEFLTQLSICHDSIYGYDYSLFFNGTPLQCSKVLTGAVNFIEEKNKKEGIDEFLRQTLKLKQALSLCSSVAKEEERIDAAFFEAIRGILIKIEKSDQLSIKQINEQINELLKQSIKSDGVINIFSDVGEEVSIFDEKFLSKLQQQPETNISIKLLEKLLNDEIRGYKRKNIIKSEEFSKLLKKSMNKYINGHITNEEVIQELIELAKEIKRKQEEGNELGLNEDEEAFYYAIVKPEGIKDFYTDDTLIKMTQELTDKLRKNQTIDWRKKKKARAKMKMIIKSLLKEYDYPPKGRDEAMEFIIRQCENWADNLTEI